MNYLGLDYGTAHIGVALFSGNLVEPLATLKTANALPQLTRLIEEHRIEAIIIGLPDGPVRQTVEEFIQRLRHLNLAVFPVDETLSSQDARENLAHTTPARRRLLEHSVSAALILKSWLDSGSHSL
jgi:putative transcription antitermination factor YqgF